MAGRERNTEGMLDHFTDLNKIQEVLREAQTGLWVIELEEGKKPRMYGDCAMMELLGLKEEPEPEECYEFWYGRIDEEDYPIVQETVNRVISNNRAEVQYSWHHPEQGRMFVRCGGVRDCNYKNGFCLRGYHQNITDTITLKQETNAVIDALSESYNGIFLWNLKNGNVKVVKKPDCQNLELEGSLDMETFFRQYMDQEVDAGFRQPVLKLLQAGEIRERLLKGERQMEKLYRNQNGRWKRIRLVPSVRYSEENPWVIIAFDDQEGEAEKQLDEASSQLAVSQIYRLVISGDLERDEYNCIHYSGDMLQFSRHGRLSDYRKQILLRMPLEDRWKFDQIYRLESYQENEYLDGTFRVWDDDGVIHYYDYYAACVRAEVGQRILLTVRNIDDKQEERQREQVLSNLCQCYYSIYLLDLENNKEKAIWQEAEISSRNEFPVGDLDHYYSKFVRNYVYEPDQEKMYRAGDSEFLQKILSPEQPVYDVDFRRVYSDGLQWVRSRFSIAEMRDGMVTKVIFANMNINDQKIREMEEEEQNRMALTAAYEAAKAANEIKSNFLAQMSHDIRTPMNAVIGMTAIALSHFDEPEVVKDCLDKINVSSNHLLSLINAILDMSKIEKGKLELLEEPFSLSELLEQTDTIIRPGAVEKGLQLNIKTVGLVHNDLVGDVNRIRQVLLNLIGNAVKYTDGDGIIRVTVQEVSERSRDVGCFVFTVEDNGRGMSEEFQKYVFAPFTRGEDVDHIQGTGLGMSIAHGIVEAMKGDIRVESKLGEGSRFTVTLYLKIAETDTEKEPEAGGWEVSGICLAGCRILLVEDNELNMEIARAILQEAGLCVDCAENGKIAWEMFEASAPGTYQAVFMDIQMPVMDGYEATRKIRKCGHSQAKTIPIIALTANAFAEDIAKALTAGMNDHVPKPIDYNRLLAVFQKNLK